MATRQITLAGLAFAVPALPLRLTRQAYPLCRKLTDAGIVTRCLAAQGTLDCTEDEMNDLAALAYLGASAADPTLTQDAFEDMPVSPPELLDAFFVMRYQTGAWIAPEAGEETEPGEGTGA